jgi:hypothetical protein
MSRMRADVLETSAGGPTTLTKQQAAKAWQATDGAASPALAMSFNTSSLTDNNTGDISFYFTSAMSNATYAVMSGNTLTFDYSTPAVPRTNYAYSKSATAAQCLGGAHDAGGSTRLDFIVYYKMMGNLA